MRKSGSLVLALGGVAAFAALVLSQKKPQLVTGKSGHAWKVSVLEKRGDGSKVFEVFSPAGSFGPHGEVSVVRYAQTGADTSRRPVVAVGSPLPPQMLDAAVSDFGLQMTGSVLPVGTSA